METAGVRLSTHSKEQRERGKNLEQRKIKKKRKEQPEALAKLDCSEAVRILGRLGRRPAEMSFAYSEK